MIAKEANPVFSSKNDLANDHIFECKGLHGAVAQLRLASVANCGHTDETAVVLQVHLCQLVGLIGF